MCSLTTSGQNSMYSTDKYTMLFRKTCITRHKRYLYVYVLLVLFWFVAAEQRSAHRSTTTHRQGVGFEDSSHKIRDSNHFLYRDCRGNTITELEKTFRRDGIVMFSPCSLVNFPNNIQSVSDYIIQNCPGDRGHSFTKCNNRIVSSDHPGILELAVDEEIILVISLDTSFNRL